MKILKLLKKRDGGMGGGTGGGGRKTGPPNFSAFNIMSMGGAWKESTLNGPRPPNRRAVAPSLDGGGGDENRPFWENDLHHVDQYQRTNQKSLENLEKVKTVKK